MVFQRMKKKPIPKVQAEEQVYEDEPETEEEGEEVEEAEEETEEAPQPKPKVKPQAQVPQPQISKQEVVDMIEGNLSRAAQLLQYLRA